MKEANVTEWTMEDRTELGFLSSFWDETSAFELESLGNWEGVADRGTADWMQVFRPPPRSAIQSLWDLSFFSMARYSDQGLRLQELEERLSHLSASSANITVDHLSELYSPDTWDKVNSSYVIHDPASMRLFLAHHPGLGDVLIQGFREVTELFGHGQPVVLKVIRDPEIEESEKLVAFIHTSLEPEEALARLDELDRRWFFGQLHRVGQYFNFNLVFA
jgi:hypothetical protein